MPIHLIASSYGNDFLVVFILLPLGALLGGVASLVMAFRKRRPIVLCILGASFSMVMGSILVGVTRGRFRDVIEFSISWLPLLVGIAALLALVGVSVVRSSGDPTKPNPASPEPADLSGRGSP